MKYGFVKVAAATPIIRVSDCKKEYRRNNCANKKRQILRVPHL